MPGTRRAATLRRMDTVLTVVAIAFVVGVLALVAYVLFELSPFARHAGR